MSKPSFTGLPTPIQISNTPSKGVYIDNRLVESVQVDGVTKYVKNLDLTATQIENSSTINLVDAGSGVSRAPDALNPYSDRFTLRNKASGYVLSYMINNVVSAAFLSDNPPQSSEPNIRLFELDLFNDVSDDTDLNNRLAESVRYPGEDEFYTDFELPSSAWLVKVIFTTDRRDDIPYFFVTGTGIPNPSWESTNQSVANINANGGFRVVASVEKVLDTTTNKYYYNLVLTLGVGSTIMPGWNAKRIRIQDADTAQFRPCFAVKSFPSANDTSLNRYIDMGERVYSAYRSLRA